MLHNPKLFSATPNDQGGCSEYETAEIYVLQDAPHKGVKSTQMLDTVHFGPRVLFIFTSPLCINTYFYIRINKINLGKMKRSFWCISHNVLHKPSFIHVTFVLT